MVKHHSASETRKQTQNQNITQIEEQQEQIESLAFAAKPEQKPTVFEIEDSVPESPENDPAEDLNDENQQSSEK